VGTSNIRNLAIHSQVFSESSAKNSVVTASLGKAWRRHVGKTRQGICFHKWNRAANLKILVGTIPLNISAARMFLYLAQTPSLSLTDAAETTYKIEVGGRAWSFLASDHLKCVQKL
jgi:hypothetical protein